MSIARIAKDPDEIKKYTVSWASWLEAVENITLIVTLVETEFGVSVDPLDITSAVISDDFKSVVFYIAGGTAGVTYKVILRIETSLVQIKEDSILVAVRDT